MVFVDVSNVVRTMDEVKHVLYLSYDGMTDALGQSQVLPYIIGLSKKGFRFHLISFEKPDRFEKLKDDIQALCDKNEIAWHPKIYTKKPPLLSTLYDVWRMRKLSFELNKTHFFSIVHCRSYLSAMVGLAMKKKFNTKFLFDMRGFWADERIDGNIWSLSNPVFKHVYNFFKRKEKQFFLESDYVISLTQNGKDEICSWHGFKHLEEKIQVIPCCADLSKFDPTKITDSKKTELQHKLKLDSNQFVLGYVGSIGTWYMLDEMLLVFKSLFSKKQDAIFLFVSGDDPNEILKKASELAISADSIRIQSAKHDEVASYISLFSASIFFIRPTYSKKASSPTKQGELMSMGIPIICNAGVGDTDKIIQNYRAGIVLDQLNNHELEKVNLAEIPFDKNKAKQGAIEVYGLGNGIANYYTVYQKLL
ncbi:MAG: glycosyltransferase [Bacteroidota bacterium]